MAQGKHIDLSNAQYTDIAEQRGHMECGWFVGGEHSLRLAFAPGTDLDSAFRATDLETGAELASVAGWLFEFSAD